MPPPKSSFLDKVLARIGRLDSEGLQTVVQRLARERQLLETLFNAIEDGILVIDELGRILYFNEAVPNLLGIPRQGAEGQSLSRYLPELDWNALARMDGAGGQRVIRHELEVTFPRERFLSLYVAPLDGQAAGSSGLAMIIHDSTEAREKTFAAIESERLHALTLLAASVAHEIGNPLNALHIHLQLMERELKKLNAIVDDLPAQPPRKRDKAVLQAADPAHEIKERTGKLEKYLGVAKGEITRLDYIVTQFLHAIRPRRPVFVMASLNDVVYETVELLRPEIENRGITIQDRLSRRLPPVPLDPAQIKQALVNLIKNAIQSMTKGGMLTLQTGEGSEGIWVSIADTGCGIPSEKLTHIFQPFYTTKKKGTGLGLMIVQRIVREHGGRIELDSRIDQGTTFRIWLPLQGKVRRLLQAGDRQESGETQA